MAAHVPKSSRISAPQLDGTEAWLCPWSTDKTTFKDIEARWGIDEPLATRIMLLRTTEYEEYLRSPHWQAVREDVWRAQKGKCFLCPRPIRDVHHRNYDRKGFERNADVVGLCGNCHGIEHNALVARVREEIRNLRQ